MDISPIFSLNVLIKKYLGLPNDNLSPGRSLKKIRTLFYQQHLDVYFRIIHILH